MRPATAIRPDSRQRGFTLIELMVASLLTAVSITGVMSMIGVGRDMEYHNSLRRQARMYATSILEDSIYHYSNYAKAATTARQVFLDSGTDHSIGTLVYATTFADTVALRDTLPNPNTTLVPYKVIAVNIQWKDLEGTADSVIVVKRIAEIL